MGGKKISKITAIKELITKPILNNVDVSGDNGLAFIRIAFSMFGTHEEEYGYIPNSFLSRGRYNTTIIRSLSRHHWHFIPNAILGPTTPCP